MGISATSMTGSPVRKIVPGTRGMTGFVPGFGKFESTLERDFMEMLRFEQNVEEFIPQPITITFAGVNGEIRKYTPDGFVRFRSDAGTTDVPLLYEVKYREDFRKDWRNLIRKFRAAKAYCMSRGWRFEVFTEREIRTTYLVNAKFLWPFVERVPEAAITQRVLTVLNDLDEADSELLLCALCKSPENRSEMIPVIAHLIAIGKIDCDLSEPLTMRSLIWTTGETE